MQTVGFSGERLARQDEVIDKEASINATWLQVNRSQFIQFSSIAIRTIESFFWLSVIGLPS